MNQRQMVRQCVMAEVASFPNLFLAARKARRGKSRRPDVEDWWMQRETEIAALREELISGQYQPAGYRFFEIREPKRRMIAAAPFRDRVVHHALDCMSLRAEPGSKDFGELSNRGEFFSALISGG